MTARPNRTDTIDAGDLVVLWKTNNGDYETIAATDFLSWINTQLTGNKPVTQYAAPSASGFSVQITNGQIDVHLILTPLAGYDEGTLVLPTSPIDRQIVVVNSTQAVTTLSITGNTVGAPTSLSANSFFTLQYDQVLKVWYRVG